MDNLFEAKTPTPCLRVPFKVLLSWNDLLSQVPSVVKAKYAGQIITNPLGSTVKLWRERGRVRGIEVAKQLQLPTHIIERQTRKPKRNGGYQVEYIEALKQTFFTEKIVCIVRCWRGTNANYDIHNPFIKPILDGFSDINFYEDDNFKNLVDVFFHFESIDETLKPTKAETAARKRFKAKQDKKKRGKKKMPPIPQRFYFDFYRLARFPNCNPIATPVDL
jgi:hypothetical protein